MTVISIFSMKEQWTKIIESLWDQKLFSMQLAAT